MQSPREIIGGHGIPRVQIGKAEGEWIMMTYMRVAHERNSWRVPYPDLIAAYLELEDASRAPKRLVKRKTEMRKLTATVQAVDGVPAVTEDTTPESQYSADADVGLTFAAENGFLEIDDSGDATVIAATEQFLSAFATTLQRRLQ